MASRISPLKSLRKTDIEQPPSPNMGSYSAKKIGFAPLTAPSEEVLRLSGILPPPAPSRRPPRAKPTALALLPQPFTAKSQDLIMQVSDGFLAAFAKNHLENKEAAPGEDTPEQKLTHAIAVAEKTHCWEPIAWMLTKAGKPVEALALQVFSQWKQRGFPAGVTTRVLRDGTSRQNPRLYRLQRNPRYQQIAYATTYSFDVMRSFAMNAKYVGGVFAVSGVSDVEKDNGELNIVARSFAAAITALAQGANREMFVSPEQRLALINHAIAFASDAAKASGMPGLLQGAFALARVFDDDIYVMTSEKVFFTGVRVLHDSVYVFTMGDRAAEPQADPLIDLQRADYPWHNREPKNPRRRNKQSIMALE
jgi:hypothetical protein